MVAVVIIIIYIYFESRTSEIIYVESIVDKEQYLVRNLKDKKAAADLLAKVRRNLCKVVLSLELQYPNKPSVIRLKQKFDPKNMTETEGNSKFTSYSVNKGEKVVLCLRAKDKDESLIDANTVTFVALHEMAHVMTLSIGHKEEFWNNFRFLLREATKLGVYKCVDYEKEPQKYCGIEITQNPISCTAINP
jgi:predicted metal-dependent hydrolase